MANVLQFPILRVTALIIIGAGALFFIALPLVQLFTGTPVLPSSDKDSYNSDIKQMFHLAQRLGYTKANELNFYRIPPNSESNMDATTLVFSSTISLDSISQRVHQLGLTPDKTYRLGRGQQYTDRQYLLFINKPYSDAITIMGTPLEINESYLPANVAPQITRWDYYFSEPEKAKRLNIHFTQLPSKDLFWKDKQSGKIVDGPIVVLWLTR